MQGVVEFVEGGVYFILGQQGWLVCRWFGNVEVVGDYWFEVGQGGLGDVGVYLGVVMFGGVGVWVEDEDCQLVVVGIEYVVDGDVVVVDGQVGMLFEGEVIFEVGGVEDVVFEYVFYFEVGFELGFVEVVFCLVYFFVVECLVLCFQGEGWFVGGFLFFVDYGLQVGGFVFGVGDGGWGELVEYGVDGFGGFGGLVGEVVGGEVVKVYQFGFVGVQLYDV